MLATDQQDFLVYTSELKSNYSRGIKKLKNILNTPSLAGEFVNNLGAVSVVLGTEETAQDGNSAELFDILYDSPYYSKAVETWLKGYYQFDDINILLKDADVCQEILDNPILYDVVARDKCTVYAKLICGLAGLDPALYEDLDAFNALKDVTFITTAVMAVAGIDKPFTTMTDLLADTDSMNKFIASTKAVSIAACSENAMDALTKNTTALRTLVLNEDALRTISQISVGMNALANTPAFISELVKNETACQIVADSDIGMYAILNSTAAMDDQLTTVIDHTIGNATAMAAMAKSDNALMIIATNTNLLNKVIASDVAMTAIIANLDGLDYFITFTNAFQAMYSTDTVKTKIYASKDAINVIANNNEAMDNINANETYRDVFLGKCICTLTGLEAAKYDNFTALHNSSNVSTVFAKIVTNEDAMNMICNGYWLFGELIKDTTALDMLLAAQVGLAQFQEMNESTLVKVIGDAVGIGSHSFWSLDRIVANDDCYNKLTKTNAGLTKIVPKHYMLVAAIMANDDRRGVIYNESTETDPLIANVDTKVGAKAIAALINLDPNYNYDLDLVTDINYFTESYADMIVLNEHIKAYETALAITAVAEAIKNISESVVTKMIASWSGLEPDEFNAISDFLRDYQTLAQVYKSDEATGAIYDNANARAVIGDASNVIVGQAAAEIAGMGGSNYGNISIICTQGPSIGAVMDDPHAMDLLVATTSGMSAVVNSDLAMNALMSRDECIRKVMSHEVACQIMANNRNAMDIFAITPNAYDIMKENLQATEIITSTPNAMAAITKNKDGLSIIMADITKLTNYVNDEVSMETAATDAVIMNTLAANSTAVNQILASPVAMGIFADYEQAMTILASSTVAMPLISKNATAMTTIFDSAIATKVVVNSPNAMSNVAAQTNSITPLLASDNAVMQAANSDVAMNALVISATAMDKFVANAAAMEVIAESHSAFSAIMGNTTAFNKVLSSATAMNVIVKSGNAMSLMVDNKTAMTAIWNNTTARNSILTTTNAMTFVVGSKTAMECLAANSGAVDALIANTTAWQAVLDSYDAIATYLNNQSAVQKLSVNNATAATAFNLLVKSMNGKKAFNRSAYRATYYSQFNTMMSAQTSKFQRLVNNKNMEFGSGNNYYAFNGTYTSTNGNNKNPNPDNSVVVFTNYIYNSWNGNGMQEIRDIPNGDVMKAGCVNTQSVTYKDIILGGIRVMNTYITGIHLYKAL